MKVGERFTYDGMEYEAIPSSSGSCIGCAANCDRRNNPKFCIMVGDCSGVQIALVDTPNDIKNISPDHLTNEN